MIKVFIKHYIYEACIEALFKPLINSFKPTYKLPMYGVDTITAYNIMKSDPNILGSHIYKHSESELSFQIESRYMSFNSYNETAKYWPDSYVDQKWNLIYASDLDKVIGNEV